MSGLTRALLTGAGFWFSLAGHLAAQQTINPTGDPKLAPQRILALDAGGHTGGVYRLIPNAYGDQLVSVSYDKTIRLWDLQTGEAIRVLRPPVDRGALGVIAAAALHPEGDLLAVGGYRAFTPIYDHRIRLISLASGETVRLLKGHQYMVFDIAFSPDGKRLASGAYDSTARIWNVETGEVEHVLKGHTNGVHAVAWSADGKHLVTGSLDGTAPRIWNTSTGASEATLTGHQGPLNSCDWSPDGRSIVTACDDAGVRLFEPDGKSRYTWPSRPAAIQSLKFSPDSSRVLYTYSSDGMGSNAQGAGVLSMVDGREISRFNGHANGVISCTFLRDGKTAVTGDSIGSICLWDAATGRLLRRLESKGRSKFACGWSPDGQLIAWGNTNSYSNSTNLAPLERTFSLANLDFGWQPTGGYIQAQFSLGQLQMSTDPPRVGKVYRNGAALSSFTLPDPSDEIRSFSLISGDKAALGGNELAYIFDVNTGQIKGELADGASSELIWCMAPSPDLRYLLVGGADQTMRIWKSDTNELLVSLFVAGDEWIAWTPQGYYAASLGGENLMGWHVNNGLDRMASFYPAARFHNSLYRPDIIRRLIQMGSLKDAHAAADRAAARVTQTIVIQTVMPPTVVVAAKQQPDASIVDVKATATPAGDDPITSMQLLIDGRPDGAARAMAAASDGGPATAQEQSWNIKLPPGEHSLSVRADTDKSYGLGQAAAAINAPGKATRGKLYVLAIGVSAYQQADLRLPLAAADAESIADALKKRGGSLFESVETKVITDATATRTGMLQGLAWLQGEMTLDDTAVIFFDAQAAVDDQGLLKLLAVNATTAAAGPALAATELKQTLSSVPGKIVLLLDAHPKANAQPAGPEDHVHGPADSLIRNLLADDCGVAVLSSTMRREVPIDLAGHGAFTQALLDGLQGSADTDQDGTIQLNELGNFVEDRVAKLTQDREHATFHQPALVRTFPLGQASSKSP